MAIVLNPIMLIWQSYNFVRDPSRFRIFTDSLFELRDFTTRLSEQNIDRPRLITSRIMRVTDVDIKPQCCGGNVKMLIAAKLTTVMKNGVQLEVKGE